MKLKEEDEISLMLFSLLGYSLLLYYILQWLIYRVFLSNNNNPPNNHIATQTEYQPIDNQTKLLPQIQSIAEEPQESSQSVQHSTHHIDMECVSDMECVQCVSGALDVSSVHTDINELKNELLLHQDILTQLSDSQRGLKEKVRQLEEDRDCSTPNILLQFYSYLQPPSKTLLGQCRFMNSISKQLILNELKRLSPSKSIHSIKLIFQLNKQTPVSILDNTILSNTPRLLAIFNLANGKILTLCSTASQGKGFLMDMRIKQVVRGELRHRYSGTSLLWTGIDFWMHEQLAVHFNDLETILSLQKEKDRAEQSVNKDGGEQKQCSVHFQERSSSVHYEEGATCPQPDSLGSVLEAKIMNWQLYVVDV